MSIYSNIDIPQDKFPTNSTALAAWLLCQGHLISGILKSNSRTVFLFPKTQELEEHIRLWQIGKAEGNCCQYENARRELLNMVKEN